MSGMVECGCWSTWSPAELGLNTIRAARTLPLRRTTVAEAEARWGLVWPLGRLVRGPRSPFPGSFRSGINGTSEGQSQLGEGDDLHRRSGPNLPTPADRSDRRFGKCRWLHAA